MAETRLIDLVITNAIVITMRADRAIILGGGVAVDGSRILEVGRTDAITGRYRGRTEIDAGGSVVMPGIIDGHNHPIAYLLGGMSDDVDVYAAVWKYLNPYEAVLTPEQTRACALGNFLEMLKCGTTCFNDPGGYHVDEIAQAAVDIGIRGIVCRSNRDVSPSGKATVTKGVFETFDETLRGAEEVVRNWNGAADGRIRAWMGLRNVYNVSDALIEAVRDLAEKYDVGVHSHVASVRGENEDIQAIFGKRSLQRYYDLGLFSPRLYIAHGGFPNETEIEWILKHDAKIAHCPTAALKGAWGIIENGMIPKMMKAGVTISLGTDTNGAAGSLDMFRQMALVAICHRDRHQDPALIGAYKALELATIEGAKACLWDDEIGSLEPGKRADIIIVRTDGPEWTHPGRDVVRKLIYSSGGYSVDTVIIDGKIIVENNVLKTLDEEAIKVGTASAGRGWLAAAGLSVESAWPIETGKTFAGANARPRVTRLQHS